MASAKFLVSKFLITGVTKPCGDSTVIKNCGNRSGDCFKFSNSRIKATCLIVWSCFAKTYLELIHNSWCVFWLVAFQNRFELVWLLASCFTFILPFSEMMIAFQCFSFLLVCLRFSPDSMVPVANISVDHITKILCTILKDEPFPAIWGSPICSSITNSTFPSDFCLQRISSNLHRSDFYYHHP